MGSKEDAETFVSHAAFQEAAESEGVGRAAKGGGSVVIDLEKLLGALESLRMTPADFEASVELRRKRIKWAQVVTQAPKLKDAAARLDAELVAEEAQEMNRRHEWQKRRLQKQEECRIAQQAWHETFEAEAQLRNTCAPPKNASEIAAQRAEVADQINRVKDKLSRNGGDSLQSGSLWGTIDKSPVLLAQQTRAMLNDPAAGLSSQRRRDLQRQLDAAESAVDKCRNELAMLEARLNSLNEKQTPKPCDAMRPENCVLVRAPERSRDELAKQHARAMGWGADDGGVRIGNASA